MKGKIRTLSDFTACYKCVVENGGSWSATHKGSHLNVEILRMLDDIERYMREKYGYYIDYSKMRIMFGSMSIYNAIKNRNCDGFECLKTSIKYLTYRERLFAVIKAIGIGKNAIQKRILKKTH